MIKRSLYDEIEKHLSTKEITVITGARQVGKTTLMLEIKKEIDRNSTPTLFLNLDYERDNSYFTSQDALIRKIELEFGKASGVVFIDEIQRKPDAGRFLKGIYDLNLPYKFIVSGSGSLELKEQIHESLAGRKRLFELKPVSFLEFLNYRTEYKYKDKLSEYFATEQAYVDNLLNEYLNFGGYPRIITESKISEKNKLIDEIFRSYLERDIAFLLHVERTEAFTLLIKLLSSQSGRMLNYSGLAAQAGISQATLKTYLWYAEKTFIIKLIKPYYSNLQKEITKSPCVYFCDFGLRNYALGIFGNIYNPNEYGFLFQNFVYNLLDDLIRWKGWSVHYWRTTDKAEVDFILNKQHEIIPVEVKYSDIKVAVVRRSMRSFISRYKPNEAWVINLGLEDNMMIDKTRVRFIPYYRLLVNEF